MDNLILTITLNPSVDIGYRLTGNLNLNEVNRVDNVSKTSGGKGLNVSRVLKQLNEDVAATGFLGGSLGAFIRDGIGEQGIKDYFISIEESTRNCIAILHNNNQTEILESGPTVSEAEQATFLKSLEIYAQKVNYITISGSLPKGVPDDFYKQILSVTAQYETPVLLDTKGELLEICLQHDKKPYLIKPNQDELADLLQKDVRDADEVRIALQHPIFNGLSWIIVTLGANGAIVKNGNEFYQVIIPNVDAVNPVGSGDAVIAGFASGLSKGLTDKSLITYGLTMGVLNAIEAQTGYINISKIKEMQDRIQIDKI